MIFPVSFFDQLRNKLRISEIIGQKVTLTRKRGEFAGLCPFHEEKTPSFTVNDSKKFYHCFGCGAHGDVVKFVAETQGLSYKDAAKKLAEDNNIEIPVLTQKARQEYQEIDRLSAVLSCAQEFFQAQMTQDVFAYLHKRGLSSESISKFGIGYIDRGGQLEDFLYKRGFHKQELIKSGLFGKRDNGDLYSVFTKRVMFPIKNIFDKVVAFGGRAYGDFLPKYINSPETILFKKSETLFGQNLANKFFYKDNYAILVEGYMDVISLHQGGFPHAVASLGTSVTQEHIMQLWHNCDEVIVCLDGDEAGKRAADRLIQMLLPHIKTNKLLSFIELPNGQDPDNILNNEGQEGFQRYIAKRISLSEKIWRNEYSGQSFDTAEKRAWLEHKLHSYYSVISDKILLNNFRHYFKNMIWKNILANKKNSGQKTVSLSDEVRSFAVDEEKDFLEKAICTFIIHFTQEVRADYLSLLKLDNVELNSFKEWVEDFFEEGDDVETFLDQLKNSRFFELFELLSGQKERFLHNISDNIDSAGRERFFYKLCQRHYLHRLKAEYAELLRKDENACARLESYIKEIQLISKNLQNMND